MTERLALEDIIAIDCFVVPSGAIVPTIVGTTKVVTGILDLARIVSEGKDSKSPIVIVSFTNLEILEFVNRKADLFPIACAVLLSVPGADYDVIFENSTYLMEKVEVTELIAAAQEYNSEVNYEAQELMGDISNVQGESRLEHDITKRAEKISKGAVRRASGTAPKPVDLAEARKNLQFHHTEEADADIDENTE